MYVFYLFIYNSITGTWEKGDLNTSQLKIPENIGQVIKLLTKILVEFLDKNHL